MTVETSRGYRIQGTTTHRIKVVDDERRLAVAALRRPAGRRPRADDARRNGRRAARGAAPAAPRGVLDLGPPDLRPALPERGPRRARRLLHGRRLAPRPRPALLRRRRETTTSSPGSSSSVAASSASRPPSPRRQGYTEVALHSVRLTLWWEACGFAKHAPNGEHRGKGYEAHIPDAVLYTNDAASYRAFVRGLFEADGNVNNGYASFSTVSDRFSRDVQTLLLALGFATTRKVDQPTFGHKGANPIHVLRLLNASSGGRFLEEISFVSARKRSALARKEYRQAARYDLVPVSRQTVDRLAPENDNLRKTMLLSLSRIGLVSRRSATALLERTADPELAQALGYFYDEIASATARRRAADLRPLGPGQRHLRRQRLRQPQHHRVHDGLRHHRHRAGHRPHQVQEARRRGLPQDREQHGPGGPPAARLHADPGRGDRRLRRRARDDRGRARPQARAPAGLRLRLQAAQRRALHRADGPRPDDGRRPAVPLRGDQQDRQHARGGDGRRDRADLPRGLAAGPQGDRDLPRQQQAQPAAQHDQAQERRREQGGRRRRRRAAQAAGGGPGRGASSRTAAGSRPSGPRSPTSSTSPATRATSRSASTRTASRARSSSRWRRRAPRSPA